MAIDPDSSLSPVAKNEAGEALPAKDAGFLRRNSLRLAGILNLIGDVGFLGGGIKTRDPYKITGGGLYTLGGLNLALFGKVRPEQQRQEVSQGVADIIKTTAGGLPEGSDLAAIDACRNAGLAGKTLYHHAAQNTLGVYTAGAAAMLASGIKKHNAGLGSAGLYYGLSSLVFKLGSFLIPEKNEKENRESGKIRKGGFLEWIRQKPLRLFGYGSMVTDSLLALDTYQEYKYNPQKGSYRWTAVTTITYILADLMMAISNKDHANATGKFSAEDQHRIERLAADAIAREPKEMQAGLVRQIAGYLAARPELTGGAEDLAKAISGQVGDLQKISWASRASSAGTPDHQPGR